jgi:RNA polymerase sigma-70 factor (ECF subfamily)
MRPADFCMPAVPFTSPVAEDSTSSLATEALAHTDALYRTALRLTRNPAEAEDLVQDTFLKAVRFERRFQRGTNLRAWLFTIQTNTWRNRRRDRGRDPVAVDSDVVERAEARPAVSVSPEDELLRASMDVSLQHALEQLAPAFREAVWLRDVEEFSYGEIAEILGIPVGTVMSRISRGRRPLHQLLSEVERRDGGATR